MTGVSFYHEGKDRYFIEWTRSNTGLPNASGHSRYSTLWEKWLQRSTSVRYFPRRLAMSNHVPQRWYLCPTHSRRYETRQNYKYWVKFNRFWGIGIVQSRECGLQLIWEYQNVIEVKLLFWCFTKFGQRELNWLHTFFFHHWVIG